MQLAYSPNTAPTPWPEIVLLLLLVHHRKHHHLLVQRQKCEDVEEKDHPRSSTRAGDHPRPDLSRTTTTTTTSSIGERTVTTTTSSSARYIPHPHLLLLPLLLLLFLRSMLHDLAMPTSGRWHVGVWSLNDVLNNVPSG
jgi:hypothetical protein